MIPGAVHLTVREADRTRRFYEDVLGLESTAGEDGTTSLAPPGGEPIVVLYADPAALPRDPRRPGLFHVALLYPSRSDLANALTRLAVNRHPIDGAADHLVSEALYLSDPEGNGIELYRDRPRAGWPRSADGQLEMATLPIDLDGLITHASRTSGDAPPPPAETRVGHTHLQVSDIAAAEAFYAGLLGFDVTVRGYPGALFVSSGGYHHHIGLNTWNSRGSASALPGSAGIHHYELVTTDPGELDAVRDRLSRDHGRTPLQDTAEGILARDPSGTAVLIRD